MATNAHQFDPTILRAYDIRGEVGKTLSEDDAYAIGQAFATMVIRKYTKKQPVLAVAYDGRHSSPHFEEAVSSGMASTGAIVKRVGLGPTPMLYFAVRDFELDGGIMITGSHNPPSYNGFKIMYAREALFGEEIQRLGDIAEAGDFESGEGVREVQPMDEQYLEALLDAYDKNKAKRELKVVWDNGNGAAGEILEALVHELPGEHHLLYGEVDGDFPNHHPDPSDEKNLQDLIKAVREQGSDLGLAFDGDADRLGVVDSQGRILWGDQIMQLLAEDVLKANPGATVIADVKASQSLFNKIEALGGKPLIWKTGHSFIKAKMAEEGAKLAGEMSGHIFFADKYYGFDDGLYAAVRLLNYLAGYDAAAPLLANNEKAPLPTSPRKRGEELKNISPPFTEGIKGGQKLLDSLLDAMEKPCNTPEIRFEVPEERKFKIVEEIAARLKADNVPFSDIDGVRVMKDFGWWLLRASNTQPALVARCEAKNEALLEDMKSHLKRQLALSDIALEI